MSGATKVLCSPSCSEELTLCGSRLLLQGFFLILSRGLCCLRLRASARAGGPAGLEPGPEGSGLDPALFSGVGQLLGP